MQVQVTDNGTTWSFRPLDADAKRIMTEELQTESWQWLGDTLVVDHRPARYLCQHLADDWDVEIV